MPPKQNVQNLLSRIAGLTERKADATPKIVVSERPDPKRKSNVQLREPARSKVDEHGKIVQFLLFISNPSNLIITDEDEVKKITSDGDPHNYLVNGYAQYVRTLKLKGTSEGGIASWNRLSPDIKRRFIISSVFNNKRKSPLASIYFIMTRIAPLPANLLNKFMKDFLTEREDLLYDEFFAKWARQNNREIQELAISLKDNFDFYTFVSTRINTILKDVSQQLERIFVSVGGNKQVFSKYIDNSEDRLRAQEANDRGIPNPKDKKLTRGKAFADFISAMVPEKRDYYDLNDAILGILEISDTAEKYNNTRSMINKVFIPYFLECQDLGMSISVYNKQLKKLLETAEGSFNFFDMISRMLYREQALFSLLNKDEYIDLIDFDNTNNRLLPYFVNKAVEEYAEDEQEMTNLGVDRLRVFLVKKRVAGRSSLYASSVRGVYDSLVNYEIIRKKFLDTIVENKQKKGEEVEDDDRFIPLSVNNLRRKEALINKLLFLTNIDLEMLVATPLPKLIEMYDELAGEEKKILVRKIIDAENNLDIPSRWYLIYKNMNDISKLRQNSSFRKLDDSAKQDNRQYLSNYEFNEFWSANKDMFREFFLRMEENQLMNLSIDALYRRLKFEIPKQLIRIFPRNDVHRYLQVAMEEDMFNYSENSETYKDLIFLLDWIKLPDDKEQQRIAGMYYKNKLTLHQISNMTGMSITDIEAFLYQNIDTEKEPVLTDEQKALLLSYYEKAVIRNKEEEKKSIRLGYKIEGGEERVSLSDSREQRIIAREHNRSRRDPSAIEHIGRTTPIFVPSKGVQPLQRMVIGKKEIDDTLYLEISPKSVEVSVNYLLQVVIILKDRLSGLYNKNGELLLQTNPNPRPYLESIVQEFIKNNKILLQNNYKLFHSVAELVVMIIFHKHENRLINLFNPNLDFIVDFLNQRFEPSLILEEIESQKHKILKQPIEKYGSALEKILQLDDRIKIHMETLVLSFVQDTKITVPSLELYKDTSILLYEDATKKPLRRSEESGVSYKYEPFIDEERDKSLKDALERRNEVDKQLLDTDDSYKFEIYESEIKSIEGNPTLSDEQKNEEIEKIKRKIERKRQEIQLETERKKRELALAKTDFIPDLWKIVTEKLYSIARIKISETSLFPTQGEEDEISSAEETPSEKKEESEISSAEEDEEEKETKEAPPSEKPPKKKSSDKKSSDKKSSDKKSSDKKSSSKKKTSSDEKDSCSSEKCCNKKCGKLIENDGFKSVIPSSEGISEIIHFCSIECMKNHTFRKGKSPSPKRKSSDDGKSPSDEKEESSSDKKEEDSSDLDKAIQELEKAIEKKDEKGAKKLLENEELLEYIRTNDRLVKKAQALNSGKIYKYLIEKGARKPTKDDKGDDFVLLGSEMVVIINSLYKKARDTEDSIARERIFGEILPFVNKLKSAKFKDGEKVKAIKELLKEALKLNASEVVEALVDLGLLSKKEKAELAKETENDSLKEILAK